MARIAGGAGATFAVTGCAAFMAALDNLVVTTALPTIRADLDAGLDALEWTVNAYTLAFAVFLLTAAAIGDRFGRKRTFLAGIAVFTVASAGAALATSTSALVAARAVQGLGAAVLLPLSLTLLVGAVYHSPTPPRAGRRPRAPHCPASRGDRAGRVGADLPALRARGARPHH